MKLNFRLLPLLAAFFLAATAPAADTVVYPPKAGPGAGKHIVFLTGDEEYRGEEGLPQLAKILSQRHGFKCTVLFAINPKDGTIDPSVGGNLPGAEALDTADIIVMLLRFRAWPDDQMKHFVDAYLAGKPIIALRTSTHAFNYPGNSTSPYAKYSYGSRAWSGGFGKQVLGETWVNHWAKHKIEATKGLVEKGAENDPLLRGVRELFGDTDVYEAYPTADAKILFRGQALQTLQESSAPANYLRKRRDGQEQGINDPMMPVVWTRLYKNEAGNTNKILCTTMGSATDLKNEDLRRLLVNACYWGANIGIPSYANVELVGEFHPSMYGFGGARKGVKPDDLALPAQGK